MFDKWCDDYRLRRDAEDPLTHTIDGRDEGREISRVIVISLAKAAFQHAKCKNSVASCLKHIMWADVMGFLIFMIRVKDRLATSFDSDDPCLSLTLAGSRMSLGWR